MKKQSTKQLLDLLHESRILLAKLEWSSYQEGQGDGYMSSGQKKCKLNRLLNKLEEF